MCNGSQLVNPASLANECLSIRRILRAARQLQPTSQPANQALPIPSPRTTEAAGGSTHHADGQRQDAGADRLRQGRLDVDLAPAVAAPAPEQAGEEAVLVVLAGLRLELGGHEGRRAAGMGGGARKDGARGLLRLWVWGVGS